MEVLRFAGKPPIDVVGQAGATQLALTEESSERTKRRGLHPWVFAKRPVQLKVGEAHRLADRRTCLLELVLQGSAPHATAAGERAFPVLHQ